MSSPDKAGHLKKQGNSRLRDWKTRYCAVKGTAHSASVHTFFIVISITVISS